MKISLTACFLNYAFNFNEWLKFPTQNSMCALLSGLPRVFFNVNFAHKSNIIYFQLIGCQMVGLFRVWFGNLDIKHI